jgi:hypothetical protein
MQSLCRFWKYETKEVDNFGQLMNSPKGLHYMSEPNILYWFTDKVPHETLKAEESHYRQWFRLVVGPIGAWFVQHSTGNPLGIRPDAPLIWTSKFA